MKYLILSLALLAGCSALLYGKEIETQDCISSHIRAVTRNGTAVSESMYDKIVDSCRQIFTGRP